MNMVHRKAKHLCVIQREKIDIKPGAKEFSDTILMVVSVIFSLKCKNLVRHLSDDKG